MTRFIKDDDELRRIRRDIIERGKVEAPGEEVIKDEYDPPEGGFRAIRPAPAPVRDGTLAGRLLRGRIDGAKKGKHQSGPSPYGYRREDRESFLVIDPAEAEVVKLIFREYLRLGSILKLITFLNTQGIRTRRNKLWSRAGVSWILKNETYVGRVHFGDINVRGIHTPIIANIIFNKVQKLVRANDKKAPRSEGQFQTWWSKKREEARQSHTSTVGEEPKIPDHQGGVPQAATEPRPGLPVNCGSANVEDDGRGGQEANHEGAGSATAEEAGPADRVEDGDGDGAVDREGT